MVLEIFAFSIPQGKEWLLVITILCFLFFWIKVIVEIIKNRFLSSTCKFIWLIVVIFTGIVGALIYKVYEKRTILKL